MKVYFAPEKNVVWTSDMPNFAKCVSDDWLVIEVEVATANLAAYQSLFDAACDAYNKMMLAKTCPHCHGSGVHVWSDAFVGLVDEVEPCLCVSDGICPVCGSPLTDEVSPSCTVCHFQYNEFNALLAHAQDEFEEEEA